VNYEDSKTLREFARLQLRIAQAKLGPAQTYAITDATIHKSAGYRKLYSFAAKLSPAKRLRFVAMLRRQIEGVREVMAQAKATGEPLSMADVVIEMRDTETGAPVGQAANMCPASGGGIPGVERGGDGREYIRCPRCRRRWSAYDIGFKIPDHEPDEES